MKTAGLETVRASPRARWGLFMRCRPSRCWTLLLLRGLPACWAPYVARAPGPNRPVRRLRGAPRARRARRDAPPGVQPERAGRRALAIWVKREGWSASAIRERREWGTTAIRVKRSAWANQAKRAGRAGVGRVDAGNEDGEGMRPPNIILIVVDDLGSGGLGCYGQRLIQTPHLDRMAQEGMRFEQHYAGSGVCALSRGVLLTRKHAGHASVRGNPGGIPLPEGEVTLATLLSQAGYMEYITPVSMQAVRFGPWKAVRHRREDAIELYNLAEDEGERNDLSRERPQLV